MRVIRILSPGNSRRILSCDIRHRHQVLLFHQPLALLAHLHQPRRVVHVLHVHVAVDGQPRLVLLADQRVPHPPVHVHQITRHHAPAPGHAARRRVLHKLDRVHLLVVRVVLAYDRPHLRVHVLLHVMPNLVLGVVATQLVLDVLQLHDGGHAVARDVVPLPDHAHHVLVARRAALRRAHRRHHVQVQLVDALALLLRQPRQHHHGVLHRPELLPERHARPRRKVLRADHPRAVLPRRRVDRVRPRLVPFSGLQLDLHERLRRSAPHIFARALARVDFRRGAAKSGGAARRHSGLQHTVTAGTHGPQHRPCACSLRALRHRRRQHCRF
mmetsp:Transcript_10667/g.14294  ORF Transcript_10667/g.14294 Transcript_10667/m.14294 type:complete len:328 (-) Transcript_10667:190-1173(-)